MHEPWCAEGTVISVYVCVCRLWVGLRAAVNGALVATARDRRSAEWQVASTEPRTYHRRTSD